MNNRLSGFAVKAIIYLLLYNLNECTLKYGSHHLFTLNQKQWPKKVNENFYIKLTHLPKILVSWLFKYFHLNLGNLVFEKKFNDKSRKVNFLSRKIFRGNLNEAISANALFRFSRKIVLKRKFTISKIPILTPARHEGNAYNKERESNNNFS